MNPETMMFMLQETSKALRAAAMYLAEGTTEARSKLCESLEDAAEATDDLFFEGRSLQPWKN